MTRRLRRFIFFTFTVFFAISSVIVVFFAQGYRLDFDSLKIVKTGGIFIKTSVDDAKIYINDKYVGSTNGILNHSTLISGLKPKKYSVFIYKENYYPWNKTVEVKSEVAVELNNVLLFPLELKQIKIAELPIQTVSEFTINDGEVKIENNKTKIISAFNLSDGKLISSEKSKLVASSSKEILSPDKNKKLYALNNRIWIDYLNTQQTELIADYEPPITLFEWFNDSDHLIWFANNELIVSELDNRGDKRNSVKFYLNIDPPFFWDQNNSDFYFFKKNALYKINFED